MGGIVCQKEQLFEIVLFSFEAGLNAGQLAVVSHSFLFEASHHLLISLLHCLGLVEFYHHAIEPVFQKTDGSHHGVLLHQAHFILFHLF